MFNWGTNLLDMISQSLPFSSRTKKRGRDEEEPALLKGSESEKVMQPNLKRQRIDKEVKTRKADEEETSPDPQLQSSLFRLPPDTLDHVCSYLTTKGDRHSLLLSCRAFKDVYDSAEILRVQDLEGDPKNRTRSILYNAEKPELVIKELLWPYVKAGNASALYMIGMIVTYCYGDKLGVAILGQNSDHGCHRSSYALGLILRDCDEQAATKYLEKAAKADFLPACQEIMESAQVKQKFGDLLAQDLEQHFDPAGLSRLIGSCYIRGRSLRHVSSSHCWNPLCGRWALKAATQGSVQSQRQVEVETINQALPRLPGELEVLLERLVEERRAKDVKGKTCVEIPKIQDRNGTARSFRVSRMKMCSQCRKAKYCSKLCQVYDWRSGRHKTECPYLDMNGNFDMTV